MTAKTENENASATTDGPTAQNRAADLRATLAVRREAEDLLAEAAAVRRATDAEAVSILEQAQRVAEEMLAEGRKALERVEFEARERAEAVLARASREATMVAEQARSAADQVRLLADQDVAGLRARVRAEVEDDVRREQATAHEASRLEARQRTDLLLGDIDTSVRRLTGALKATAGSAGAVLEALSQLSAEHGPAGVEPEQDPMVDDVARDVVDDAAAQAPVDSATVSEEPAPVSAVVYQPAALIAAMLAGPAAFAATEPHPAGMDGQAVAAALLETFVVTPTVQPESSAKPVSGARQRDTEARPLGWLFRSAT